MSNTIDQRVVDMQFNNGEFEKGIQQSMKSLEALKKGLELDKSAQSLSNLEKIVGSFSFDGLVSGVQSINSKFLEMGSIGYKVLQNLTDKAIDAGISIAKSISIDQVTAGFSKYAQKSEAVQTIMSATGKTVDEVEDVLGRLNEYTDWTSFNFAEMTSTIGKFVSNGVDLDVAERAMEGIGNQASLAGASIQNANHAMYNFAQALSAGKVTLMDWKSIELANMGTQQFKELIIETATELGTLSKVEDGVGKTTKGTEVNFQNFNTTLSEGWFTSDVLIASLEKYADTTTELGQKAFDAAKKAVTFGQAMDSVKDAVSTGWMNTFQLIFGNFEEASELWTNFADGLIEVTDKFTSARNALLEGWRDFNGNDGRKVLLEGLKDVWDVCLDIAHMIKTTFSEFFPSITAENLMYISNKVKEFGANLKETYGYVRVLIGGATSLFSIGEEKLALNAEGNAVEVIEELNAELKKGTKSEDVKIMQERLMSLGYSLDRFGADGIFGPETEAALKAFQREMGIAESGVYDYETHLALLRKKGLIKEIFEDVGDGTLPTQLLNMTKGMKTLQDILRGIFSIVDVGRRSLSLVWGTVKHIFGFFKPIGTFFGKFAAMLGRCVTAWHDNLVESGFFENALERIKNKLDPIGEKIRQVGEWLEDFFGVNADISSFSDLLDHMKQKLFGNGGPNLEGNQFLEGIKSFFDPVLQAFEWIKAKLAPYFSSPFAKGKTKDSGNPFDFLGDIGERLKGLTSVFGHLNFGQLLLIGAGIFAFIKIFKLFRAPAKFMQDLSGIPGAISEFIEGIGSAAKRFGKDTIGTTALKIATSLAILVGSITLLTTLDQEKMWAAAGVVALLGGLLVGIAVLMTKFVHMKTRDSLGLLAISASILILSFALKQVASLDVDAMLSGLLALGLLFVELALFSQFTGGITTGLNFINLGKGLQSIVSAIQVLSGLDEAGLKHGLVGLGLLLVELGLFMKLVGGNKFESGMGNMLGLGLGVLLLVAALKSIAKMDMRSIGKGLVGLGGLLIELGIFLRLAGNGKARTGLFAMIGLGVGVLLLAKSLKILGEMNMESIGKGLVGLGGILLELIVFMKLTKKSAGLGMLGLIGLGYAIGKIVDAVKALGEMDTPTLRRGLIGLGLLMIELRVFMKSMKKVGFASAIGGAIAMVALGAGIHLFIGAIRSIGEMETGKLVKGFVGLTALMILLKKFMKKLAGLNFGSMIGLSVALIALGTSMNLIAWALGSIGDMKLWSLAKGLIGMKILLSELGDFLKQMNGLKLKGVNLLFSLGGIAAVILAIDAAMTMITDVPTIKVAGFGLSLGVFLEGVAKAIDTLSKVKFKDTLFSLGKGGVFIAGITALFSGINTLVGAIDKWTGGGFGKLMSRGGKTLGQALGGFISGVIEPFSNGEGDGGYALVGWVDGLLTDIQPLGDKLSNVFDAFKPFFDKVKGVPDSVFTGIKTLSESLLLMTGEGILDAWSRFLTGDGESGITHFVGMMEEVGPQLSAISDVGKDIPSSVGKNINKLVEPMGALMEVAKSAAGPMVAGLIEQLIEMVTGSDAISPFIDMLIAVGPKLNDAGNAGKDVGEGAATNIDNLAAPLESLGNLVSSIMGISWGQLLIDIADWVGDSNKLGEFVDKMIEVAPKLITLSQVSEGITSDNIALLEAPMTTLGGLVGAVVGMSWGEWFSSIPDYLNGKDNLIDFIDQMIEAAPKLVSLGNASAGINADNISKLEGPMRSLSGLVGSVSGISWGEWWSSVADWLTGKDNLIDFIDQMIEAAPKLVTLGQTAEGLDDGTTKNLTNMSAVLGSLGEAADKMPKTGGLLQNIVGEISFDDFATGLEKLGEGLKSYYASWEEISTVDNFDPTAANSVVDSLIELENKLEKSGGLAQWFSGEKDLGVFGERLKTLGQNMTSFQTDISGLNFAQFDEFSARLEKLVGIANSAVYSNPDMAFQNIEEFVSRFSSSLSSPNGVIPEMGQIGAQMAESITSAINQGLSEADGTGEATTAAINLSNAINNAVIGQQSSFVQAGRYIPAGIAVGIWNNRSAAINAAVNMATSALRAARSALAINSPSKEFAEIGMYSAEGLAQGLSDYTYLAANAGADMAEDTLSTVQSTIGALQAAMQEGLDSTPTITPVVDLSGVNSGASAMRSLLGSRTLGTNLGVNPNFSTIYTNDNSDVVNAIDALNAKIESVADAVAQMKVVIDTGAMVGQIASKMDAKLGQIAAQKGRLG